LSAGARVGWRSSSEKRPELTWHDEGRKRKRTSLWSFFGSADFSLIPSEDRPFEKVQRTGHLAVFPAKAYGAVVGSNSTGSITEYISKK